MSLEELSKLTRSSQEDIQKELIYLKEYYYEKNSSVMLS